jgi:pullulanase-type alpha-1,6-glucosidase
LDEIDPSIYVYGEGWDFGEVAGNARGVNATQANMAGTGIGVFNDRLRDAARGGSPFGGQQEQGFITGLYTDPNETDQGTAEEQLARLLHFSDLVRVGLAGNLAAYEFTGASGETVTGADVDYNGNPAGYTADPQENIVYVSKHDNETLFDAVQYKAPAALDMAGRVRIQNLGNSIVMLSQGVPFFQAGDDLLRSKSLDRNSYNSGDWFNALDWTGQTTNWGRGLPQASDNESMWPVMAPLLANPDLAPQPEHTAATAAHFREMAQIRAGSPLFRLPTAEDVQARLRFLNTGPDQVPGVIVMDLSDATGDNLDPNYDRVVVVFNANDEELVYAAAELAGRALELHPVLAASADPVVAGSLWDADAGEFTVPGRTTVVFVQPEGTEPVATATPEPTPEPTIEPTAEPTATPEPVEPTAEPPTVETTAVAEVATATEETQATPEDSAALETVGEDTTRAGTARPEVVALSIGVIVTVVGVIVGLVAWLRGRK